MSLRFRMLCSSIIISFIFSFHTHLLSQNLITDPGFEKVNRFFDGIDTVYEYKQWKSLLTFKKQSPDGLPQYSKYIKWHRNNRYLKYWLPFEGDSYMFSHIVYFRNLFQTQLITRLSPGLQYKISFKYKILSDGFSKEKIEFSINDKIGVMLTTKDMTDSTGLRIFRNNKIELNPQIVLDSFNADSLNLWLEFTRYYVPKKSYSYFIIGNFQPLIGSHELGYHPIRGVSYRIDQVSIELIEDDSGKGRNNKSIEVKGPSD